MTWPAGFDFNLIRQKLIERGDAEYLYFAGRDWPAERYADDIRQALLMTKNAHFLWRASEDWPAGRFSDEICHALVATRNAEYLLRIAKYWPEDRRDPSIYRFILESKHPDVVFNLGFVKLDLPGLAQALIAIENAECLYRAGRYWPSEAYCNAISQALIKTCDPKYLCLAGWYWPDERYTRHPRSSDRNRNPRVVISRWLWLAKQTLSPAHLAGVSREKERRMAVQSRPRLVERTLYGRHTRRPAGELRQALHRASAQDVAKTKSGDG